MKLSFSNSAIVSFRWSHSPPYATRQVQTFRESVILSTAADECFLSGSCDYRILTQGLLETRMFMIIKLPPYHTCTAISRCNTVSYRRPFQLQRPDNGYPLNFILDEHRNANFPASILLVLLRHHFTQDLPLGIYYRFTWLAPSPSYSTSHSTPTSIRLLFMFFSDTPNRDTDGNLLKTSCWPS